MKNFLIESATQILIWGLLAFVIGVAAIIFAGGCAWLALGMRLGWNGAIYAGALPFIPGEIIKMALVLAVVQGFELTKHA